MKTSIATVSIPGTLPDKVSAISAAGFDGVEVFEQDFITYNGTTKDVARLIADHGLVIDLYQPVRDFEGLSGTERQRAFDMIERKFDLMGELGTDLLLVSSTTNPNSLGGIERIADDFGDLAERANKRGLRIGYEALPWARHVKDYRDAWEVVRRVDDTSVGLVLDSFLVSVAKTNLDQLRSIPSDKIFHVQLADASSVEMDLRYLSRHFRCMPGEGDLPLIEFAAAVCATGYKGAFSLEVMNDEFRGALPRTLAVDGYRSLLYLMDSVSRLHPEINVDTPSMPARARIEGIEFVEFAADDTEAETLAGMLGSLGFSRHAKHVSKRVELWRQGDINLVINTENEGYAHSAYVMHGTCVCDVGISVADARSAIDRATTLGASVFQQKRSDAELDIPAIRGVGGSVLHFFDRQSDLAKVWEHEFTATGEDAGDDVGLTCIDHIAQTMNHEELLSWTLFYLSIFDVERTPIKRINDPDGVVSSRAIHSGDGKGRLTLNGVDTHRTFAGRFMADSFGSSVQHVAFRTDDILKAAEKLKNKGFEALPIPENYYLDLASRFGLSEDEVEALARYNILYDKDEDGEYFQLFSVPYGEGFFFEIVERRGGYNAYGGPNAPYRTAAQKRRFRPNAIPRR